MRLLFTFVASLAFPLCGTAAPWRGTNLKVEFVSEVTAVRPGQPFYAGIYIQHDPGCHTYWMNPGLEGLHTNFEWTLPDGWTAGEIEWPTPDKVKMANINTHGYERDVLLMAKITPPAKPAAASITLQTKASWMCCGKTCSPGWHDFTLTLPVEAGSAPAWSAAWHPVFEKERTTFPVPSEGWKFAAVRKGDKVVLSGQPEKPGLALPPAPVFYSSDNLICSHPAQHWRKTATGFEAELEVSNLPPDNPTELLGLLRSETGWNKGTSRAVTIRVPLK